MEESVADIKWFNANAANSRLGLLFDTIDLMLRIFRFLNEH